MLRIGERTLTQRRAKAVGLRVKIDLLRISRDLVAQLRMCQGTDQPRRQEAAPVLDLAYARPYDPVDVSQAQTLLPWQEHSPCQRLYRVVDDGAKTRPCLVGVGLHGEGLAVDGHGDRPAPQRPPLDLRLLSLRHRLARRSWKRDCERLGCQALELKWTTVVLRETFGQSGTHGRRHDISRLSTKLPNDQRHGRLRERLFAGFREISKHCWCATEVGVFL